MAVRTLRYNTFEGRTWKGATFVTDTDALAFCEAAQIYDRNQQKSIVDLVRRLKTAGLWSKMKAIYPFVGGTASSHKFNLKDPKDADAAFRLTFSGGWTHSADGAKPNGTNGYANTFLKPSVSLILNTNSISYYSGTGLSETSSDPANFGTYDSNTQVFLIRKSNTDILGRSCGSNISASLTGTTGFISLSRQSSTVTKVFRNAVQQASGNSGGTLPTNNIFIGNIFLIDGPYSAGYVLNDFRFAHIGDDLSDNEMTNLYNIVDLYQKRLGRSV